MNRKSLLNYTCALIILIFFMNLLANKFYWYVSIWYFDMIMHTLGGLWVGLAIIYLFKIEKFSKKNFWMIILGVLIVGLLWEVFEFEVGRVIWVNPANTLSDTLSDLICDLSGGALSILYYFRKNIFK